jgi:2-iminobutanoate/2-iminopropanoate deaminase
VTGSEILFRFLPNGEKLSNMNDARFPASGSCGTSEGRCDPTRGAGTHVGEPVKTDRAPAAIGPYSQAVRWGGLIFCSGQIPLDPATGRMIEGEIEAQTERILENLAAVLEAGGGSLRDVVKTTVYLVDLNDFPKMNAVYGRYFPESPPARATVQVARLPAGALVEIDAIAAPG